MLLAASGAASSPSRPATTTDRCSPRSRGGSPAPRSSTGRTEADGVAPRLVVGDAARRSALDLTGLSPFDANVYRFVAGVPWGERVTYGDVAAAIGRPGAARAVGGAMGAARSSRSVPCHRVVRAADGWQRLGRATPASVGCSTSSATPGPPGVRLRRPLRPPASSSPAAWVMLMSDSVLPTNTSSMRPYGLRLVGAHEVVALRVLLHLVELCRCGRRGCA